MDIDTGKRTWPPTPRAERGCVRGSSDDIRRPAGRTRAGRARRFGPNEAGGREAESIASRVSEANSGHSNIGERILMASVIRLSPEGVRGAVKARARSTSTCGPPPMSKGAATTGPSPSDLATSARRGDSSRNAVRISVCGKARASSSRNPPSRIPTRTDPCGAMPHEKDDRIQSASRHVRHRLAHLGRQDAGKRREGADRRGDDVRTRRISLRPFLRQASPSVVPPACHDRHHHGTLPPYAPGCILKARCALPKRTPEANVGPPRPQGVGQPQEPPIGVRAIARAVRRKNHGHGLVPSTRPPSELR